MSKNKRKRGPKRLREDGTAYRRRSDGTCIEISPDTVTAYEKARFRRRAKRAEIFGPSRLVVKRTLGVEELECGHMLADAPIIGPHRKDIFRRCIHCKRRDDVAAACLAAEQEEASQTDEEGHE